MTNLVKYATMCYLTEGEKVLLLFRNNGKEDMHQGNYVAPGGKTERPERGIDGIKREFLEETGLTLLNPKLRIIAKFYNEGRILGGKENQEDWLVEVYESQNYSGTLRGEEGSKCKLEWMLEKNMKDIETYPGDKKIYEFLKENKEGVFEILIQYKGLELIRFDAIRVA